MEYKIFPARSPWGDSRGTLQALGELDSNQQDALAAWFESTTDFDTTPQELPRVISESTLLPRTIRR